MKNLKVLALLVLALTVILLSFTSCDVIGDLEGIIGQIPGIGNNNEHVHAFSDATCTAPKTCECGATEGEANGHTVVIDEAVDATCTEDGLTAGEHCSVCNEVLKAQTPIEAKGHSYESAVTAPTCTEAGFTTYTCACGDSYVADETEAKGHSYESVVTAPTCTEAGYTTYTCSACDDTYTADETAATGHSYETVVTAPTCTEAGYTTYTCSACDDTYTADETAALGHKYEAVVTAPTCTEAGFTTYTCACGDSYVADETEAKGHSYESVVTAPTCTEAGFTTYTCSVCNDTYTADETAALGHKYESVVTAPTCTEAGYTTYTCSVCNDTYTADETAATGHSETSVVTAPTCTEDGYTTYTCTTCGATRVANEIKAKHSFNADGVCTVCEGVLQTTTPEAGKPYIFGMYQGNLKAVYYLKGGMNGYYMATTTDPSQALAVYLEETEGGYYMYCFENGSKKYINMVVSGTHVNGAYEAKASTVYTIDVEHNTVIGIVNGEEYWFGTRNDKTFNTVGPCLKSFEGFYCEFYTAHIHSFEKGETTAPTCTEAGYTTYTCTACGASEQRDAVDATGHTFVEGKCACGAEDPNYEAHVHNHDTVVTAPTCTEEGYTTYTCACGDSYVADKVAALGHNADADDVCSTCGIWCPDTSKAYTFGMYQGKVGKNYYLVGGMNGYYMATTEDESAAMLVYLEETEGGYYMYCFENGNKTYINMVTSGSHVNGAYEETATTVYTVHKTYKTVVGIINGIEYWFGTRNDNTYTTVGPCAMSYNGFYCVFNAVENAGGEEEHKHDYAAVVTDPTCTEAGYTTYTCSCGDSYTADETEATGHTFVEGKCACGAEDPNYVKPGEPSAPVGGEADFDSIVTSNANGDSSYKNTYTTTNGWTVQFAAIQTGKVGAITEVANPQFPVIGPDNTHKAVCLTGNTANPGKLTSPILTTGISKLTINYTKMFTDTELSVTVTITDAAGNKYTHVIAQTLSKDEKYVVYTDVWTLETPVVGDFTIEIVNNCPTAATGNKDRMTILDIIWEGAVAHTHEYTSTTTATCTAAGITTYTCECGDTYTEEVEKLGHVDANLDVSCDRDGCTSKVAPAADSVLSNFTANNLGSKLSTSVNYYVVGTVAEVLDARNGIFLLDDGTGELFYIRLPKNADGVTHANWEIKLVLGDKVQVYGKVNKFTSSDAPNGSYWPSIQGGVVTILEQHPHDFTFKPASCSDPAYCACGQSQGEPLGCADTDGDNLCDDCGKNVNAVYEYVEIRTDNNSGVIDTTAGTYTWSNDNFSVQVQKDTSTQLYSTAKDHMRVYKGNNLVFVNKNGLAVKTITVYLTNATQVSNFSKFLTGYIYTKDEVNFTVTINVDSFEKITLDNPGSTTQIKGVEFGYEK